MKILMVLIVILFIAVNMQASDIVKEIKMHQSEVKNRIILAAKEFVGTKYPDDLKFIKKPIVIHIYKNLWKVTYVFQKGTLGGAPEIYIEDHNYTVVKSILWQ